MIKKYFALSVITAAVAVAGCSSDDDTPAMDPMDPMDPPVVVLPDADPSNDSSGYDIIANSVNHTQLLAAIDSAGLANTLDDPDGEFTIFAPTNAAFDALEAAAPGTVAGYSTEELARVLQYHVVEGTITSTSLTQDVTDAPVDEPHTEPSLVTDAVLTFTNPEAGLSVDGVVIETADGEIPMGEGATGIVYSIGMVLSPPAVVEPDPMDPPVTDGTFEAALATAGNYTVALAVLAESSQKFNAATGTEADPWAVFVPSDEVLAGAAFSRDDHLVTGSPLKTPEELIATPPASTFGGVPLTIGGTDAASLTINGFAVTEVFRGDSIVYTIDGVLAQ